MCLNWGCFGRGNRPVRGPGLQGCRNRIVSCRPRALTRRFGGFLKQDLEFGIWAGGGIGMLEFKNKVANLPQAVELGVCGFGFLFFTPAVWLVQILEPTHY